MIEKLIGILIMILVIFGLLLLMIPVISILFGVLLK
jgi:hypothetical protein